MTPSRGNSDGSAARSCAVSPLRSGAWPLARSGRARRKCPRPSLPPAYAVLRRNNPVPRRKGSACRPPCRPPAAGTRRPMPAPRRAGRGRWVPTPGWWTGRCTGRCGPLPLQSRPSYAANPCGWRGRRPAAGSRPRLPMPPAPSGRCRHPACRSMPSRSRPVPPPCGRWTRTAGRARSAGRSPGWLRKASCKGGSVAGFWLPRQPVPRCAVPVAPPSW